MRTENEQSLEVPQELLVLVLQMPVDLLVFGLDTVGLLAEFTSVVVSAVVAGSSLLWFRWWCKLTELVADWRRFRRCRQPYKAGALVVKV
jgi:hypothetical protein